MLNRTASAFGINILGTTCNNQEDSSQIDDGCSTLLNIEDEAMSVSFSRDVWLETLEVSQFGTNDLGEVVIEGATNIDITSTGDLDLGNTFLAAGDSFTVEFVGGNGFSFDNFTVYAVPEPAAAFLFVIGHGVVGRRVRRGARA